MSAEAIAAAEACKGLITDSHVKAALKADKGSDANLTSWSTQDFTNKGDNYANIVTSVNVKYTMEKTVNEDVSYVVKILPLREPGVFNNIMKVIWRAETRFYRDLTPRLNSLLASVGEAPLGFPRCHYFSLEEGRTLMFLEDLRTRGFKMLDRKKGLDVPQATLVFRELAKVQAASYLLLKSGDEVVVDDLKDLFSKDWLNYNEDAQEFSRVFMTESINNSISLCEQLPEYKRVIAWLQNLIPKVSEIMQDQLRRQEPFIAVCHGDASPNNLLFRYDESNAPVEVMMVDIQCSRLASPATDLTYLMYTCVNASDRMNHLDQYLDNYHHVFRKVLEAQKVPMPFTRQELQEEYKDKLLYGVIHAMVDVPAIIGDASEVPDIGNLYENDELAKQKNQLVYMLQNNPIFRSRFLSMFDDMMEFGIIP